MIIDIHTHTFPDDVAERAVRKLGKSSRIVAYSDGTAEGLRRNAEAAGIGLSVIQPVATSVSQVEHINTRAIQRNIEENLWEKRPGNGNSDERVTDPENDLAGGPVSFSRLLSFGCIHPEYENYKEELRRIAEAGVPGIKLHPYFHGCDMDDIRYLRILDAAAENGLIVLTHAGYDQGFPGEHSCKVPMLRRIMQEIKGLTMIAAHMGGWKEWDQVPELLADTGIYLDTSFATGRIEPEEGKEAYWTVESDAPDPGMTTYRERERNREAAAAKPEAAEEYLEERDSFREMAKSRSVFGTNKLLDPEQFAAIVRAFPDGHILFGTDSPWSDPGESIAFIRSAPLPEETKQEILGGAAERLLHGK